MTTPNIKISAATPAGTLLSSDMVPLARSGDTNAYNTNMAAIATFTNASLASGAYGNVGRSFVHNGLMNVQQRGAGPWTSGYTADRWHIAIAGASTISAQVAAASDTNRASIGDEACRFLLNMAVTGTAGAGDAIIMIQPLESVRRLSGKIVTVSFYANSTVANFRVGVSLDQQFGSGGSPSASVLGNGQSISLSGTIGTFTRSSFTFTMPSTAGMTLGTNGDDSTTLNFWLTAGSSFATRSGNVGVQTGAVALWGIQLEIGSQATPLERLDPRMDLANCMRFYRNIGPMTLGYYNAFSGGANPIWGSYPLSPLMRAAPTVNFASQTTSNSTGASLSSSSTSAVTVNVNIASAALGNTVFTMLCSADL